MVVVFFVFVSFFFFFCCMFLSLSWLWGSASFFKRGEGVLDQHFLCWSSGTKSHSSLHKGVTLSFSPLDDHPVFSLHNRVAVQGGVYVNVARGDRCYLSPCCWEDICPAGDNSSLRLLYRGREGDWKTQNKHPPISLESRASPAWCEKPQTQPRTALFSERALITRPLEEEVRG